MTQRLLHAAAVVAAAVLSLSGCADDEPSAEEKTSPSPSVSESPEESPTSVAPPPAPDSSPLRECLLSPALDRGVYGPVRGNPSPEIQQLADDAGADLFLVVREDRGLVYVLLLTTAEAAEALVVGVQPTLEVIAADLSAPGAPASGSEGPVAFGVIPVAPDEIPAQLRDEVSEDLADCLNETGLA